MGKIIVYDKEAEDKILNGAKKIAKAVSVTMGPRGKNVILGKFIGAPVITKDGVSVAREVVLTDPVENLVAQLIKESAGRTVDLVGDGTTTATVLTEELLIRGKELISSGYGPINYRKAVEIGLNMITQNLNNLSKQITNKKELLDIASISANNDSDLGKVIAEAFDYSGLSGTVVAEAKPGVLNYVTKLQGIEFQNKNKDLTSKFFVGGGQTSISFENCRILLVARDMTHFDDCINLFTKIHEDNLPVLIIAKSIQSEALISLYENNRIGKIKVACVEIPTMFSDRDSLDNLSIMTGAKIIEESFGLHMRDANVEDLGFAKNVYVDKYNVKIVDPKINIESREYKLSIYNDDLKKLLSESARKGVEEKIRFLNSKASVITVGYSTELELREKSDRVDDAISATKAALEQGYLPGGGIALLRASSMIDLDSIDQKYRAGVHAFAHACERPIRQILSNADADVDGIISKIKSSDNYNYGYNVADEKFGDMVSMGVIDPAKVTKTAIANASSISLLLINTEAIVSEDPDKPTGWQPPAGWRPPEDKALNHKY